MDKGEQIWESLGCKEFREEITTAYINVNLAVQIMRMRESRQLSWYDLATLLGKSEKTIVRWEDPNCGQPSLADLKALAAAFDVALLVKFIPFSELVRDTVSPARLSPASFEDDRR